MQGTRLFLGWNYIWDKNMAAMHTPISSFELHTATKLKIVTLVNFSEAVLIGRPYLFLIMATGLSTVRVSP